MEAWNTANTLCAKGHRPSIERVSRGRQYERLARVFLGKQGFEILKINYRIRAGEIDLLVKRARGLTLIEVRGRETRDFLPSRMISARKKDRLQKLAKILVSKYRAAVAIELIEILGRPPWWIRFWGTGWIGKLLPLTWWGVHVRCLRID